MSGDYYYGLVKGVGCLFVKFVSFMLRVNGNIGYHLAMIFLKLGGSLITDKTQVETIRPKILQRVAAEIATALSHASNPKLLLGHGSGSFGHVAGAKYGTRDGVSSAEQWRGFVEVSAAAAKLNAFVRDQLLDAGVSVISLPPHASAQVQDGVISYLDVRPIQAALAANLLPLVMGDVAFDNVRGGTIVSTEEVMGYLTAYLKPSWLLLAGETGGVYDLVGNIIPKITRQNLPEIRAALGGSRGTDVTGGMLSKVLGMLDLVDQHPTLSIRIFSGLERDNIKTLLSTPETSLGTLITA